MKIALRLSLLFTMIMVLGCAENAQLRVDRIDLTTAAMRFNWGPLITEIDAAKEMQQYCFQLTPQIIDSNDSQLPGQYRFQKTILFRCIDRTEEPAPGKTPPKPIR